MDNQKIVDEYLEENNFSAIPKNVLEELKELYGVSLSISGESESSMWEIRRVSNSKEAQAIVLLEKQNTLLKERVVLLEKHIAQAEEIRKMKEQLNTANIIQK